MSDAHPKTIGRYEVLGMLGKGAMGVVYRAIDPAIDRVVAVKTIRVSLAEEELAFYEERFAQEIRTVGKLNHPHIVTIYDVGRTDEYAYMAMEYIDGPELKLLMAGTPMNVATAVELVAQTAEGLAFAHSRDIVHRDVKPSNIMVVFDDDAMVAKITDFGIARAPTSSVKTMTGMILGSPRYMSPEQVVGKNVGTRSDIFSLGVVLYEMLTGTAPFDAETVSSIMYQTVHVREEPMRKANAEIPEALEAIVAKALAKNADERFQTMKEFSRALRELGRTLAAPLPALPIAAAPAARTETIPPAPGMPAEASPEGHKVSPTFDSLAGTMRLAALTDTALDVTRVERPDAPLAAAPPERGKAAVRAPSPVVSEVGDTASIRVAPGESFPLVPAVLLGGLAFVAVVLGLALAF